MSNNVSLDLQETKDGSHAGANLSANQTKGQNINFNSDCFDLLKVKRLSTLRYQSFFVNPDFHAFNCFEHLKRQ